MSFHANLGSSRHSPPFYSFDNEHNLAHVKPCQYRRRKRREECRNAKQSKAAGSDNGMDTDRADPIQVIEDEAPNAQSCNLQSVTGSLDEEIASDQEMTDPNWTWSPPSEEKIMLKLPRIMERIL